MRVTSDTISVITGTDADRLYRVLTSWLMKQDESDYELVTWALSLRDACAAAVDQHAARTGDAVSTVPVGPVP